MRRAVTGDTRSPSLPERLGRERPLGVVVAFVAWFAAGAGMLLQGLNTKQRVAEESAGLAGTDIVVSGLGDPSGIILLGLGLSVVFLSLGLVLGLGWTVYPLAACGVVGILVLAGTGSYLTLLVMACLVLGLAPLGSRRSYAYLTADQVTVPR